MRKNIVLNCLLKSDELNNSYKDTILSKLKIKYENSSLNSGYIIKVISIKEFIHNTILNGDTNIKLLCDCDVYKPVIEDVIKCKVDMIHINGIFVSLYNIKILIPNKDNIFDIKNNVCFYKNLEINIGDYIDIIIRNIRFENFNYTCIGYIHN